MKTANYEWYFGGFNDSEWLLRVVAVFLVEEVVLYKKMLCLPPDFLLFFRRQVGFKGSVFDQLCKLPILLFVHVS